MPAFTTFEVRVLNYCRQLVAVGIYPDSTTLAERFPDRSTHQLGKIRVRGVDAGILTIPEELRRQHERRWQDHFNAERREQRALGTIGQRRTTHDPPESYQQRIRRRIEDERRRRLTRNLRAFLEAEKRRKIEHERARLLGDEL